MLILEIIVVLLLFVLNGFFAMAELAIVSSRRAHLERLAKEGRPGAQVAIALADDPARMLAAVQIGFTTSAMLAGIFSGATLADRLEAALLLVPVLADYSKPLSIAVVTVGRDLYRAHHRRAGAQVHRPEQSGVDCDSRRPAARFPGKDCRADHLAAERVDPPPPPPAAFAPALQTQH